MTTPELSPAIEYGGEPRRAATPGRIGKADPDMPSSEPLNPDQTDF
jgi:hypothetical protein